MQVVASILWRRLDAPGHDACRLEHDDDGWQLDGAAVFRHGDGRPARLDYRVRGDRAFHALSGTVRGWLGRDAIDLSIARDAHAGWMVNGAPAPGLGHCVDLDLGFTPATNLLALRRLALAPGEAADAPAAWIDLDSLALSELPQRYERRGEADYWYTAPSVGYQAMLTVTPDGFVQRYPRLWDAVR